MRARDLLVIAALLAACARRPDGSAPGASADTALRAPDGSTLPADESGQSIRRGHALLASTRDSLPGHVGNALRCLSCHVTDRHQPGLALTGVYARFPQFRSRAGFVQRLEDRINDCFRRSLNGTPLPFDDPAMRDIVTYLQFISRGERVGDTVSSALGPATQGDTAAGGLVFTRECARCHGVNGEGRDSFPPLWGPRSFNIGAGMGRMRTITAFVQRYMPRDRPGTLTEADAIAVAAYVTSRPRPDFPGKERDWPCGHRPPDVPYATSGSGCATPPGGGDTAR